MKRHSIIFTIGLLLTSNAGAFSETAIEELRLLQQCSAQPAATHLMEVDPAFLQTCIALVRRWAERSAITRQPSFDEAQP